MNFEEFLYNKNKMLYDKIVENYNLKQPLDDTLHQKAMDAFYDYLLVGGMPEAVEAFLETGRYQESREILKDLYDNYLGDMDLYQASPESIVRAKKIFRNIFTQLNKESKNFKSSLIEEKARGRDLVMPIDWLSLAFLVHKSSLVKERVTLPLIDSDESLFRLYLADVGMFSYQSALNAKTFLSKEGRNTLSGIFFENYIAVELVNCGFNLFYWRGKSDSEFEFLIEHNSQIIPIDVKKTKGSLKSLEKFKEHNSFSYAIKISENKYGFDEKNGILTIPFYEVFLLFSDLKKNEFLD